MIDAIVAIVVAVGALFGAVLFGQRRGARRVRDRADRAAREAEDKRDEIYGEIVSVDPGAARERLRKWTRD